VQEQQTALQRRGEMKSICCIDVIINMSVAVCTPSASWLAYDIFWNVGTEKNLIFKKMLSTSFQNVAN
jgi:hypothetical protein